ncbi:MAG: hypothetical protein ACRDLB_14905 [Actinomycetota bacterium]
MTALAWVALVVLASGVLIVMFWATVRWLEGPGSKWIASLFNVRPRNDHADDPR